jgi:hypothetical protein
VGKSLHLSKFGGGVALEGSADTQRTDELQLCDSYDIGERGQLVAASDLSNYDTLLNGAFNVGPLYGITVAGTAQARYLLAVGEAYDGVTTLMRVIRYNLPANTQSGLSSGPVRAQGALVTFASFPFIDRLGVQQRPTLICIAPRETEDPRAGNGLYVHHDSGGGLAEDQGPVFDWLGTGSGQYNEATAGTKSKALYPRGIVGYNNHVFYWGFHNLDGVKGDAPNRLGFSNLGNPFKIGNDPGGGGDRDFLDTDAINIGGSGEIIRAGYPWAGKLWIATNKELHYLAGFGRESFLTNGTVGIKKSRNVCGPNCLIEGPDSLLYGVSTEGLWAFDGATVEPIYRRVVDFRGKSFSWWDLIWTDATRGTAYPGRTNQDLVWMMSDPESMQVWVVIPWCNSAAGYGYGTDTVIIKYHTQTGGFSRQVFIGQQLVAGTLVRRESSVPTRRFIIQPIAAPSLSLRVYGMKADAASIPIMPVAKPTVTFGEYAPYGPDGNGVVRRVRLTIAWESAASLPIVFLATLYVDQQSLGQIRVSIQPTAPVAPADEDLWLDTGNTDTNLGNSVAGATIAAAGNYVLKRWKATWAKWLNVATGGGQLLTRATIPIAYQGAPGARILFALPLVSAAGRYQIEGLGLDPATEEEAA